MLDELDRLRENPRLVELLAHYAALGTPDRLIWQKRLNEMEGIDSKELSRLHGELIAFDWVEQNPSRASSVLGTALAGVYRITSHGIRDLCQIQGVAAPEASEEPEKAKPKFPSRKRKQKVEAVESKEGPAFVSSATDAVSPLMATASSLSS
jgi:hypothetical protein